MLCEFIDWLFSYYQVLYSPMQIYVIEAGAAPFEQV